MTSTDSRILRKLFGGGRVAAASTDDLQGLLLQVVLALLMIFMIAYFIFVQNQKKERVEEVMELNRQKLTLAIEKIAEDHRVRYGLNAMMTQGTDGRRTFEPDDHIRSGRIELSPAAKSAFSQGSSAAAKDYSDSKANFEAWRRAVLEEAAIKGEELSSALADWLVVALEKEIEAVRLDARGVQRSLAARLQRQWIENPSSLAEMKDAGEIADALRTKSLKAVNEETGAEILP